MSFTVEAKSYVEAEQIALKKFTEGLQLSLSFEDQLLSRSHIL